MLCRAGERGADQLDVTGLIVDDSGHGIPRDYLTSAFVQSRATDLARPDFVAPARSFGVRQP
ncbi:hypothetical protein [Saccharopolyspora sp. ID03-671]|uniref:hypothetical protein n=1 Tax=Saccharopolyspora sp. ID03-671 TaxID=3073066 RepID=UPI003873678D